MEIKDKQPVFYKCVTFYITHLITSFLLLSIVSYWAWGSKHDGKDDWYGTMPVYFTLSAVLSFIFWLVSLIGKFSRKTNIILLGVFFGSITSLFLGIIFIFVFEY